MSKPTRRKTIRRQRKRRQKIKKLREKYLAASNETERQAILEKVKKVSPWLSKKEFLAPLKEKQEL
jgi:hypothetical protein